MTELEERHFATTARSQILFIRRESSRCVYKAVIKKSSTHPQAEAYFRTATQWPKESVKLRKILLEAGLTEEFKWNKPCYSFQEANLVVLLPLKNYCALLFCKGALLKDPHGLLIKAGENTQASRHMRFTHLREIVERESILKGYLREAIAAEKAGLEVTYKKPNDFIVPEELQKRFDKSPALKTAFTSLTPGRQRGYIIHITAAKQSKTREARIEKCVPQILDGRGLNDR